MPTPRQIYVVEREPIEPCEAYPNGISGLPLTACKDEADAKYRQKLATEFTAEFGLTYSCNLETLQ